MKSVRPQLPVLLLLVLVAVLGLTAATVPTQRWVNTGVSPNDGTGDSLRTTQIKANQNLSNVIDFLSLIGTNGGSGGSATNAIALLNGSGTNTTLVNPTISGGSSIRWDAASYAATNRLAPNSLDSIVSTPDWLTIDEEGDSDCDDYGDVAVGHVLMTLGKANLVGIGTPSGTLNAGKSWRLVNHFFGRPWIPVGKSTNSLILGKYTGVQDVVLTNYGNIYWPTAPDPENSTAMYRKILASAPSNKVVMVFGGQMNNLSELWNSPADTNSSWTGEQLITNKVKELVILGGYYPFNTNSTGGGWDYNFYTSTNRVVPVTYNPAQVVNQLKNVNVTFFPSGDYIAWTGQDFFGHKGSPIYIAYNFTMADLDWFGPGGIYGEKREFHDGREMWGQGALLWHFFGTNMGMYSVRGSNYVDVMGTNYWVDNPSGPHRYVVYPTSGTASNYMRTFTKSLESMAGSGYNSGLSKGSNPSEDTVWMGRTDHRTWVQQFMDFRGQGGLDGTGARTNGPIKKTIGLNSPKLIGFTPADDALVFRDTASDMGWMFAGPGGDIRLSISNRFRMAATLPMDLVDANSNISLTIGTGGNVGVGSRLGDAVIRVGSTNSLGFYSGAGTMTLEYQSDGSLRNKKTYSVVDSSNLVVLTIGEGGMVGLNARPGDAIIRIGTNNNSLWFTDRQGNGTVGVSTNGRFVLLPTGSLDLLNLTSNLTTRIGVGPNIGATLGEGSFGIRMTSTNGGGIFGESGQDVVRWSSNAVTKIVTGAGFPTNGTVVSFMAKQSDGQMVETAAPAGVTSVTLTQTNGQSSAGITGTALTILNQTPYQPTVMALASTNIVFSNTNAIFTYTLTGNTVFTASGYAAGAQVSLVITGDAAATRTVSFPGWTWLEGNPVSIVANKVYRIDITSLSTTATNAAASYGGQL
jgi:hypothetical protein